MVYSRVWCLERQQLERFPEDFAFLGLESSKLHLGPGHLKREHYQIMELPGVLKPIGSFRHWSRAQLCQTLPGESGTDSVDDWHSQCIQDSPFGMTPGMITKQDPFPNMLSCTFSMVWDHQI